MAQDFNNRLFLLTLAVIQPASPRETLDFLRSTFKGVDVWPSPEYFDDYVVELRERELIAVARKGYYSLTRRGNTHLTAKERHLRDKLRLPLLRQCHDASLAVSEAGDQESGGAALPSDTSTDTQEAPWPRHTGPAPSRQEATRRRAGMPWPRVIEQLYRVGLVSPASDLHSLPPLRYCSFPSLAALQAAAGDHGPDRDMTLQQLALAIGISPRLIALFIQKTSMHYRAFELPKKGGGSRTIHAPRLFLKAVQYWIAAYLLRNLDIHTCCHAYVRGRSILTNARPHVGRAFVANLDIERFFDSVRTEKVRELLGRNGIGSHLAQVVADLATFETCLPQGAPTSPVISNAYLYDVDVKISDVCAKLNVTYSRYADDITLSADDSASIKQAMAAVRIELGRVGLNLNRLKTRIATSRASQRVTGLVVNTGVRPPRRYRRSVRSEFHHALHDSRGAVDTEKINRLRGHLSYLRSFPALADSEELRAYAKALVSLSSRR